jgi:hypothetical protein
MWGTRLRTRMLDSRTSALRFSPWARSLIYRTLTANIRQRRGSLVDIRLPLFVDESTEVPEGMKKVLSGGTPRTSLIRRGCWKRPDAASSRKTASGNSVYPHGRHGLRNGLLLLANHVPSLECGGGEQGV